MKLPIETERLVLRRYRYDDVADMLALVSHPSVARATPEIEATESGVRAYIDQQNAYQPFELDKCFDLAIELKEEGRVVGLLSLVREEPGQGETGYALGVAYRGLGLATEAARGLVDYGFGPLGLHRIYARTGRHDTGSWRLMERLGIRREAHFKESHKVDGRWDDEFVYAILAGEWSQVA